MADAAHTIRTYIRWMIRRDIKDVLAIESASFGYPWPEDEFIRCLRQRNCIGMVAEHESRVVGYMIYTLEKTRIDLLNLAVHPDYRRRGVGLQMIAKLKGKLSRNRRTRLTLRCTESSLDAQLFFRSQGLRAVGVDRCFYEDWNGEDAYRFVYRYRPVEKMQLAT
jgi:[ribosomal protein S18]-alanine N-acetyltransferase